MHCRPIAAKPLALIARQLNEVMHTHDDDFVRGNAIVRSTAVDGLLVDAALQEAGPPAADVTLRAAKS